MDMFYNTAIALFLKIGIYLPHVLSRPAPSWPGAGPLSHTPAAQSETGPLPLRTPFHTILVTIRGDNQ
jgi:hypothetical protein